MGRGKFHSLPMAEEPRAQAPRRPVREGHRDPSIADSCNGGIATVRKYTSYSEMGSESSAVGTFTGSRDTALLWGISRILRFGGSIAADDLGMMSRYTWLIPGIGDNEPNALRKGIEEGVNPGPGGAATPLRPRSCRDPLAAARVSSTERLGPRGGAGD